MTTEKQHHVILFGVIVSAITIIGFYAISVIGIDVDPVIINANMEIVLKSIGVFMAMIIILSLVLGKKETGNENKQT